MLRTRKSRILSGAGFALAAVAAFLAAPAAHAGTIPGTSIIWAGLNGSSGCMLHAHAHNYPLQLYPCHTTTGFQTWQSINLQTEWFPDGGNQTAAEINLVGTDECANDSVGTVYLDSCVKGDKNELFWMQPVPSAAHNWWFVNAAESQFTGTNYYMTVDSFTHNAFVHDYPAGNGQRAEWYILGS